MSTLLRLTVLTPDEVLLSLDSATKVRMWLADAPLIAEVPPGPVQYDAAAGSGELLILGGILQVTEDQVTVLTSGHQRGTRAPETNAAPDEQFDRLARRLLMSLQAQPNSEADRVSADAASADAESGDAG